MVRAIRTGQPGALVVEATGVRDIPSGPLLRIGHDRFIPGLRKLVETVREASGGRTRLLIQIIDFLSVKRRPEKAKFFDRFLKLEFRHKYALAEAFEDESWLGKDEAELRAFLKDAPEEILERVLDERELESLRFGYRERVTDMDLPHIRELPQVLPGIFSAAAVRAREAGFDGVELHYAHAYTMASFLSARNNRPDGYGGSRENRARLPLEVYTRVRERVGDDWVVGVRFLGDEVIAGGNQIEDATYFGVEFARAGFDYLQSQRAASLKTRRSRKSGMLSILTRDRAVMNVCRRCARTRAARSGAAFRSSQASSTQSTTQASTHRSSRRAASRLSSRPKPSCKTETRTSPRSRVRLWPTPTGS